MSKENKVKIGFSIILLGIILGIHLASPNFFYELYHITTSGHIEDTVNYIQSFGAWAIVFTFVLDVVVNALGFLPSIFLSTANGLIFGLVPGIIISWLAETVGVVISFVLMRTILRQTAEKIISKSSYLKKIDEMSGKRGFRIMLILRTMPYFPSGILTALGGVSRISFWDYTWANLIGKFPSTALEVVIGHDAVEYQNNMDRLMIVVCLATLVYGGIYLYNRGKNKNQAK